MALTPAQRARKRLQFGMYAAMVLASGSRTTEAPSAPVNTVAPVISGTATTGSTLTTTNGTWTGYPAPTYTYQWKNGGVDLVGATNSTYVLQATDEGDNITCTVTATNASGSASATSNTIVPTAYDSDATTYFAAMSSAPDDTRKGLLNDLIVGLKADNIWTKIAWLSVLAAHDAQAARINIKNPAQVASAVNSPTFTTDRGYKGDNATAYLDSSIAGTTLTDTDTSLFIMVDTKSVTQKANMGYRSGRHVISHGAATPPRGAAINATLSIATTASGDDQFVCISRTGTTQTIQVGTAVEDTDTVVTDTISNTNTIRFLSDQASFSDAQLSAAGWGAYLDNTDATALRARLRTYLIAVGAI